jgi:CRISPR-associated endonuclease/helicase Cas3
MDPTVAKPVVLALLVLHDIGKFTRPFQALSEAAWPAHVLGPWRALPYQPRHDAAAWLILQHTRPPWLSSWRKRERDAMLAGVIGHHGRPVADPYRTVVEEDVIDERCLEAAGELVAWSEQLFDVTPIERPACSDVSRASWMLAGLTTVADWVGSNQRWFPYHPPSLAPDAYYRDVALPRAERAVVDAGLLPPQVAPFPGFAKLTGSSFPPTESQQWAATVSLPSGPKLALIEDLTGSGKTEAALVLAHRLMETGRADGIFVALPTMATANAMYGRLSTAYRRLYQSQDRPSLALAHGAAKLHDAFRQSVVPIDDPQAATAADDDRDGARAACAAWLADTRRKAFLADVGVGTIDQALLAVLPAKFQSLRLLGLARKVLIVDEAHAYDAYMSEELGRLLTFHAALGGSAIVLSATLPEVVRGKLIEAFERGAGPTVEDTPVNDYPRVTLLGDGERTSWRRAPRADLVRTLAISHADDLNDVKSRVIEAARRGAAVAWIRNTVDDAIAAWRELRGAGVDATLFHARFAMCDRLGIEDAVVRRFGRAGGAERRGVVVATQVIEQSLDLDFDLIVSDLAPVDLLLQRAGRLWRHRREQRALDAPELIIAGPSPTSDAGPDWLSGEWRGTGAIYRDHALLWLTARELFDRGQLEVPGDVRAVVEAGYGPAATDQGFPRGLERSGFGAWIAVAPALAVR